MGFQKLILAVAVATSVVSASVLNPRQIKLLPTASLTLLPPPSPLPKPTKPPNRLPHEVENCESFELEPSRKISLTNRLLKRQAIDGMRCGQGMPALQLPRDTKLMA